MDYFDYISPRSINGLMTQGMLTHRGVTKGEYTQISCVSFCNPSVSYMLYKHGLGNSIGLCIRKGDFFKTLYACPHSS